MPAERLVTPREVRADSVPEELVALALWMADEYCSTPARALSLVLPPRGRPRTELWAERTAAPLDGERLTANQRALLAALPRAAGRDLSALRRLEARGLVAIGPRDRRRSPLTVAHGDAEVELTDAQRVRGRRGRARAARSCSTGSPARARPRSTCGRRPRRSSAGGA